MTEGAEGQGQKAPVGADPRARPAAPQFWVIAGTVMLAVAALSAMLVSLPPHDLWWQLRTGGIIAAERRIPRFDRFSYTAQGEPWLVQEWLSCLVFYGVRSGFGFNGLVGLQGLLVVATITGIFAAGRYRGAGGLPAMAGAALVLWAVRPWLAIRPQLFTYAFLAITLASIEAARSTRRPGPLLALIPMTALWANLHSGALLAPVVVAIEMAGALGDAWLFRGLSVGLQIDEADRRWIAWLGGAAVATAAATLMNPHGVALWGYPGRVIGNPIVTSFITEWQSPDFHLAGLGPVVTVFWLTLAVMVWSGPRPPLRDYLLLGLLLSMGMMYKRNLPLFALAAGPVLVGRAYPSSLTPLSHKGRSPSPPTSHLGPALWLSPRAITPFTRLKRRGGAGVGSWAGMVACVFAIFPISITLAGWPKGSFFDSQAGMYDFPIGAVRYLEQNPPVGNLLNQYRWGGYLIWRLPDVPVFIDGRAEVYYRRGVFDDYVAIDRLRPGWRRLLEKYQIRVILMERAAPLTQVLEVDPRWRIAYWDAQSTVLERRATD